MNLSNSLLSSSQQPTSHTVNGALDMNNTVFTMARTQGKDHVVGYPQKGGLASSEDLTAALLLIKVSRNATPRRWMSVSRRFELSNDSVVDTYMTLGVSNSNC
jgi:hypothetical protein